MGGARVRMVRRVRPEQSRSSGRVAKLRQFVTTAWLVLRYHGRREFLLRTRMFFMGLVPPALRPGLRRRLLSSRADIRRWYDRHWRRVTVVIPTYGDAGPAIEAVASLRRTVDLAKVRVVVADDGSPPAEQERLRALEGVDVLARGATLGFAGNVNRALREVTDGDVVLLNSDVVAIEGWLEALQHAAYVDEGVGIVGPKLVYPDGRIQSAGSYRNLGAPEWFDHRYRFRPADHEPANVPAPAIAVTGACMYLKRSTIARIGVLDERYPMAFEDVDYCLRAWHAGLRVVYQSHATLTHRESISRGKHQGQRELLSQRRFWERWGDTFEARRVRGDDGRLRIVYVTQDCGVGGGHRVVFEHLNRLSARGHDCELFTLEGPPDWFTLDVPVSVFRNYDDLAERLSRREAIKVATWWETAEPVWIASVVRGAPVYLVQDIESSYYPDEEPLQHRVLASYREEFRFLATSTWVRDRLKVFGLDAAVVAPGVDVGRFCDLDSERRDDVLLSLGRSHPLKNLDLTLEAWRSMPNGRPELWLFGVEPELSPAGNTRYFDAPSDQEVNELLNTATALVQTSRHEGFCLPALEAMAAGTPVVCTDADGNVDFCRNGVNCLMPSAEPRAVRRALARMFADADLRRQLADAGKRTAEGYAWDRQIAALEQFFEGVVPRP
jgi:GT2 family glycosyltransferase/glycosyltransferase involved in cell wall biosynthesis